MKTGILPQSICRFNAVSINMPMSLSTDIRKATKTSLRAEATLNKKSRCWRDPKLGFKLHHGVTEITNTGTHVGMQTNGTEEKTHTQTHAACCFCFVFTKMPKILIGENKNSTCRRLKFYPYLSLYTKKKKSTPNGAETLHEIPET